MRRILYLYPKRWRDRYADEMDQLLDDAPLTVRGAANMGAHAAAVRLRDGATLAGLSALLATAALLPLMNIAVLWVNFVVLPNPMDAWILVAVLERVPPSLLLALLGLAAAVAPMLHRVTETGGPSRVRVRWRMYPIHAGLALIALAGVAMTVVELYDQAWHGVAQWYWAACATACHEAWMAPVSLAGILYPWILLAPAAWFAWRRGRGWTER
jgi:hypothetical protein